jgi:hypothetical protein
VKIHLIILVFLLGLSHTYGQKVVKKVFLRPQIATVQIEADRFFEVIIESEERKDVELEASMEGEYQRDLGLEVTEDGNSLLVVGAFQPFFIEPNDKLSAHKVVAVSLHVRVPENIRVLLYGTSTNVLARGIYKELKVVLSDGQCIIQDAGKRVDVSTQSGAIFLEVNRGRVLTQSRYGDIEEETIPNGTDHFSLNSVSGNITVKQLKSSD